MSPASVPASGGQAPASRLACLLAAALDSIFTFDAEQRLLEFNPAAERTFGYRAADVIGRPLAGIILPARSGDADSLRVLLDGAAGQRGQRVETTARRADGSEFPCEIIIARFEEDGRPLFTALLRDLTERRRTEEHIRELSARLERDVAARTAELSAAVKALEQQLVTMVERERELGRLKADFVYTVTHEYRTPLSVVLSSAEILERYLDRLPDAERMLHVREIRVHARRLADLVDEVLFLGRADAGSIDLDLAPVDLRGVCREVTESIVLALGAERTVHLSLGGIPPRVLLDERLVRHIVGNLVHNALKYSTPDKPAWVDVCGSDGQLTVRVRDEGIGIPKADQSRLFQSFQRASNVGTISGSGLGLVVVKRCVEMHGGTVEFRSAVGEGSEFTVRLPLTVPPPRSPADEPAPGAKPVRAKRKKNPRAGSAGTGRSP